MLGRQGDLVTERDPVRLGKLWLEEPEDLVHERPLGRLGQGREKLSGRAEPERNINGEEPARPGDLVPVPDEESAGEKGLQDRFRLGGFEEA